MLKMTVFKFYMSKIKFEQLCLLENFESMPAHCHKSNECAYEIHQYQLVHLVCA